MLDGLLVHMKDRANSTARTGNCEAGTRHLISLQLITSPEIKKVFLIFEGRKYILKNHAFRIDKAFKIMTIIIHIPGIQTRKHFPKNAKIV